MTGLSYILADVATNEGEALAISQALMIRLAVVLGAGCVTGIFLGFIVRGLRVGSAFMGGTLGGVLAAVGFMLAAPRFGETLGFIVAGGLLGLGMTLMVARARLRAATAGDDEIDELTTTVSSPVPTKTQAAAKPMSKPDAKPDPAPDPDPAPADESESESESEKSPVSNPQLKPDPKPAPRLTAPSGMPPAPPETEAPESKTAHEDDDEAAEQPPESEAPKEAAPIAHQKATKKPSAMPSPPKPDLKPKPTQGSSTSPAWMQDH